MGLNREQKQQVVAVRKLLSAADKNSIQQGFALLMSLQDVAVARVFTEGISIDDGGKISMDAEAERRAHFRQKEHRSAIAVMVLRAAGFLDDFASLDLSETTISDLTGLEGLTTLKTLNLYRCVRLQDISGLANLINLEELILHRCRKLPNRYQKDRKGGGLKRFIKSLAR